MTERLTDDVIVLLRESMQRIVDQHTTRDVDATLEEIVATAVAVVPGAAGGGITRTADGTVQSSHATDETIGALDALQSRLGEGPCLDAATDPPATGVVFVDDLACTQRWPRFAPEAVKLGYRSMVSTHLTTGSHKPHSALNLYGVGAHAFDDEARHVAGMFAVQAAVVLHGAHEAAQLRHAVASRDTIGQAKGILMERFTLDDAEAFDMLVRSSQDTNVKLVDVAQWLVGEAIRRREDSRRPSASEN